MLSGVERRDNCLKRLHHVTGGQLVKNWDGESIPVIVGNLHGADEIQIECRQKNIPYIYMDHGYFRRDLSLRFARFCVSHYHNTDWRPYHESPEIQLKEWKQGRHIVILPPAEFVAKIYNAQDWLEKTLETLRVNTDRLILIKRKHDGQLKDFLNDCHAVVSFGSVGDVEAVLSGVPVFTSEYSPASPVSLKDFTKIESPIYPERTDWIQSLYGSEWEFNEMQDCWERLCPLLPSTIL